MASKESNMSARSDADLQAIQTSVAFKNISDAVEQYRRQFGLAFLGLVAFSAIHVGLVVIANLYTMQTTVNQGQLTDASDSTRAVGTAVSVQTYDLGFVMSSMDGDAQIRALSSLESASFVDNSDNYRQYTVTGFQLGGYKRSELKLYTSVGHILEFVRGKGLRVHTEVNAQSACNCTGSRRSLLGDEVSKEEKVAAALEAYANDAPTADLSTLAGVQQAGLEMMTGLTSTSGGDGFSVVNLLTGLPTYCDAENAACIREAVIGHDGGAVPALTSLLRTHTTELSEAQKFTLNNIETNMDTVIERGKYLVGSAMAGMKQGEFDDARTLIDAAAGHGEEFYATLGLNPWSGTGEGKYDVVAIERDVKLRITDKSEYNFVGSVAWYTDNDPWSSDVSDGGASGGFACTGTSADTYVLSDTDLQAEASRVCMGDDVEGQVLGGYFFSPALGTYEAFLAIVPSDYCSAVKSMDTSALSWFGFFLFYLHGWGESAGVIVELKEFLHKMKEQDNMYHSDLVLIAPDDNGTPFGGRTWYRNSDFTGYHTDMIVWELPTFVTASTGLTSYANALFGCSMGGAGSLNVLLTYPTKFVGAAPFNAPTEANSCIAYGTCHLECLVDAFMCELVWTSPGVAYNPFILIAAGDLLATVGFYQPVALGIAEKAKADGMGGCMKSGSDYTCAHFACVVATNTGRLYNRGKSEGKLASKAMDTASFLYDPDYYDGDDGSMFWLDPYWFVVVTQGFMPTHNIYTDAENCPRVQALLDTMPTWRLTQNSGILSTGQRGGLFIFMSTDANDEFGIAPMTTLFVDLLQANAEGSFYEDTYGVDGHTMSVRDFKTAIQFFSDVFGHANVVTTNAKSGLTSVRSAAAGTCPVYLRLDEVSIGIQSSGALLDYKNAEGKCASTRREFVWGIWDCGGCPQGGGAKKMSNGGNPVDDEKFTSKQTTRSACYDAYLPVM